VYVTGRVKDIIFRGGRNIYPHELEEIIGNIPGIRKGCTAVFASAKDGGASEKLVVLAESRENGEEAREKVRQKVIETTIDLLGMAPDDVVIGRPGIVLKTSSGKIRRSACRQLYESGHLGRKKSAVWLQLMRMSLTSVKPMLQRLKFRLYAMLYACYCWFMIAVGAAVVWCGVMLLPAGHRCWSFAGKAVRTLCRVCGIRLVTEGEENFPRGRQYVVVSDHMSYLDSLILTGVLPDHGNFVAKAELGGNPFLRRALRKLGVYRSITGGQIRRCTGGRRCP